MAGDRGGPWGLPEERVAAAPDLVDRLRDRAAELPELPRQATHTDFRGANLLCQDGEISGILDFEEARLDHAMVDLANAVCLLGTWYHEWQPISADAQTLLIDSYTARRPLVRRTSRPGWRRWSPGGCSARAGSTTPAAGSTPDRTPPQSPTSPRFLSLCARYNSRKVTVFHVNVKDRRLEHPAGGGLAVRPVPVRAGEVQPVEDVLGLARAGLEGAAVPVR